MKDNEKFSNLVEEIRSLPEPDYDKNFDKDTQDEMHRKLMHFERSYMKKKKRGIIMKRFTVGLTSVAALALFAILIVPMIDYSEFSSEPSEQGQRGATDENTSNNDDIKTNDEENIQITNGEEAVRHLKQHLTEGTNEDISFGTDGILETDSNGSYYTVQLVDIPLRLSGKTGNLGYYKVYQDGQYERYQVDSSNSDSEIINNNKAEFLEKLHSIQEEMEELQENSEATTTVEMEEEAAHIYRIWDVEMNAIYGVLKEQLSEGEMDQLREEQRNWIIHRDETAKEASLEFKGGSMESLQYVATQATLTRERCFELVEEYMR